MSKQTVYDKVELLGVEVDVLSLAEAIDYICQLGADRQSPACYVVKPYVEFLARAARDPSLAERLNHAELSVADGVAVLWAAHYLYAGPRSTLRFWRTLTQIVLAPAELNWPIPERAAGTNFTWPLLEAAATRHLRVFLVGKDTPAAIELVAATIQRAIPSLIIAGTQCGRDPASAYGHVSPEWLQRTATRIHDSQADLILVGMGFPLQENTCAYLCTRLEHGVCIGEGGTFDYESFGGTLRKAPAFVQNIGLEWLWRLGKEPKRLLRQLAIPRFIYLVWRSRH